MRCGWKGIFKSELATKSCTQSIKFEYKGFVKKGADFICECFAVLEFYCVTCYVYYKKCEWIWNQQSMAKMLKRKGLKTEKAEPEEDMNFMKINLIAQM